MSDEPRFEIDRPGPRRRRSRDPLRWIYEDPDREDREDSGEVRWGEEPEDAA